MPNYIDPQRIHRILHNYALPPDTTNSDGSWTWTTLQTSTLLRKEVLFSGETTRLMTGKYKNKPVIILQSYNAHTQGLWTTQTVYSNPQTHKLIDRLLPNPNKEPYSPKLESLTLRLPSKFEAKISAILKDSKHIGFSCSIQSNGQQILVPGWHSFGTRPKIGHERKVQGFNGLI